MKSIYVLEGWDLTECDTDPTNPSNPWAVRGASLLNLQVTCGGKKNYVLGASKDLRSIAKNILWW